jgi:hypothetical protein
VRIQSTGNASSAMNKTFPGTATKVTCVTSKALPSMRVNSESLSNEIRESDSQSENVKHKEFEHDEEL